MQVGVTGRLQHVDGAGVSQQDWVEAFSRDVLQPESTGGIGLGIEIDQENATTCLSRPSCDMDSGGGLSDTPLLIDDGNDSHTQGKRRVSRLSSGFPERFT